MTSQFIGRSPLLDSGMVFPLMVFLLSKKRKFTFWNGHVFIGIIIKTLLLVVVVQGTQFCLLGGGIIIKFKRKLGFLNLLCCENVST